MLSAVQHGTRVALRSAKRESGHFHPYSKPVQEHWGKYPGGSTDGSSGYTHGHGLQGSAGALWNGPHQFPTGTGPGSPPLGLVVTKRRKDIATDTFVQKVVWGSPYGEDLQRDFMAWVCILGGALLVRTSISGNWDVNTSRAGRYGRGAFGLVAVTTGLAHAIPGTVNLR